MKKSKNEVVVKKQAAPTEAQAAEALKGQYRIVVAAETAAFRERVKFGAMLLQWDAYLGEIGHGHGVKGGGLQGWLAANCPEIGYRAAQSYKEMARRAIMMLGGGAMASAALIGDTVTRPDGVTVEVSETTREDRERLFAECDSRRKLEQAWFDFAKRGEREAGNGERRALPKMSKTEEAKVIWTGVMNVLDKSAVLDAVPLLPGDIAEVCFERVTALRDALKARMKEEV